MPHYTNGAWWPAWGTLFLPYLAWLFYLCRKTHNDVDWRAAFATALVFELVIGVGEIISVSRGHWVYNEARIWGIKLFNVPIEEHLLYYFFSPLIVITVMHAIYNSLGEKEEQ